MSLDSIATPSSRFRRLRTALRDALRGLRAGRGTTAIAFIVLSFTMAAATVTFSVVDGVALRQLPYSDPERLVGISLEGRPGVLLPATPQDYFSWLENTRALESLGAARPAPSLHLEIDGVSETLITRRISANLFDVLGVSPAAGRFFGPEHERSGGPLAVVLSHAFWTRRFGANLSVIGRRFAFGQESREVVGVLPPGVWYPMTAGPAPDLYIPYIVTAAERLNNRGFSMSVVGRLRRGMTIEQARADIRRTSPAVVVSLHEQVVGPAKDWLFLVLVAVTLVLLVACANVATLLLARAATRTQEFATRVALGASPRWLAATLLLEGLILALASATAGLVVSAWSLEIAKANLPPGLSRVSAVGIDARVVSVSIAAAAMCGAVFSGAPAWAVARGNLVSSIKSVGGPVVGGHRRGRALAAFLVANMAFVCVLLVATTFVVVSFVLITTADLGFDRRNVMTLTYQRSFKDLAEVDRPAAAAALRTELERRASSVPGVTDVAISTNGPAPLSGGHVRYSLTIPRLGETRGEDMLETRMVTPNYFRVMGMRLIRGRMFTDSDRAGAPLVMLINDVAARRFFPDRDPIGEVVTFRGPTTIVGVMKGVHFDGPEEQVLPEMYVPADQQPFRGTSASGSLFVRTNRHPRGFASAVRDAIRPALVTEPGQPQFVEDYFQELTAGRRFNAQLMSIFGLIAIVIGAIGIYATMAFVVAQQIRMIGVKMALGASPSRIMRSVLRNALGHVALGTAIGLTGAWVFSQALASFVFGIRSTDPIVYVAVGAFLSVVGLVAAMVPALRAARLDPVIVMRQE